MTGKVGDTTTVPEFSDDLKTITLVERRIVKIVNAERALEALATSNSSVTNLPYGTLAYSFKNGHQTYVVARPSGIAKVTCITGPNRSICYSNLLIPTPPQIYRFVVDSDNFVSSGAITYNFMFEEPDTIEGSNITMMSNWLPNTYTGGRICGGTGIEQICGNRQLSVKQRILQIIREIQGSVFNSDLSGWESIVPGTVMNPKNFEAALNCVDGDLWKNMRFASTDHATLLRCHVGLLASVGPEKALEVVRNGVGTNGARKIVSLEAFLG